MNFKNLLEKRYILRFVMLLVISFAWYAKDNPKKASNNKGIESKRELIYTKHALCRMNCREISKQDVNLVFKNGELNQFKSKPNDKPCPTFAYESKDDEGDNLRVVVAYCEKVSKLVTVINLDKKFNCNCR